MNQEVIFKVCRFPAFMQRYPLTGPVTVQNYLKAPQEQYTPALSLYIIDCSSEKRLKVKQQALESILFL